MFKDVQTIDHWSEGTDLGGQIGKNAYVSDKVKDNLIRWGKKRLWLESKDQFKMIGSKPRQSVLFTES